MTLRARPSQNPPSRLAGKTENVHMTRQPDDQHEATYKRLGNILGCLWLIGVVAALIWFAIATIGHASR